MRDPSLVRFRRVVAAACDELERRREEVNDLNVFPVPDGDTGDNMAMTMRAVLDELDALGDEPLDQIGRDKIVAAVARAALLGARGNSGVILSQIVRGAAEELVSRPGELVDPVLVAAAFAGAADAAYRAPGGPPPHPRCVRTRRGRRLPLGARAGRAHDADGGPRDGAPRRTGPRA